MGCAFDILWRGWAPRTAYLDYPLGHSGGKPFDAADQYSRVRQALDLLSQEVPVGEGLLVAMGLGGWEEGDPRRLMPSGDGRAPEDLNETIGGGGTPSSGLDTRQPRDEVRRYQAEGDVVAEEGGGLGVEGGQFCVSSEALRQALVKQERGLPVL
jgi:hypothetical protein